MKSGVRLCAATAAVLCAAAAQGQIPRAPDGHPDLQGIWTNATSTPVERPLIAMPAFAEALLRTSEFPGDQVARLSQPALIVDPPDGRVPRKDAAPLETAGGFDGVEDRPLGERCLLGAGSTAGPPMMPALYNNYYQIVQTPDYVMIMAEMVHDVRMIRMNAAHPPIGVRQWLGDSVGHWDGDTLVVDTTNFTDKTRFRGASQNLHIVERFTRAGVGEEAGTFLYNVTIDDPATFSKPWTMEYPFVAASGPIFEYACHEGNYAMTDILAGARKEEAATAGK